MYSPEETELAYNRMMCNAELQGTIEVEFVKADEVEE